MNHRDQQELAFAHCEAFVEPVPFGQRARRYIIEPGNRKGGFATSDLVANGFNTADAIFDHRRGRGRALNCASGEGGNINSCSGFDRARDVSACRSRRFGHTAGQGNQFPLAQRVVDFHAIILGQFVCWQADTFRQTGKRVTAFGQSNLIIRIGNNAAIVGFGPIFSGFQGGCRRVNRSADFAAQIQINGLGTGAERYTKDDAQDGGRYISGSGCHLDFLIRAPCCRSVLSPP